MNPELTASVPSKGPVWLRRRLESLGPTFVKLGQYLALRPDLIPEAYCDELLELLDQVPPVPWSEAQQVLVADFGAAYDEIFLDVDSTPIASGSIAQVHVGRLRDGTKVALKIRRPGIETRVARDLRKGRMLAGVLQASGMNLVVSPREVIDELSAWMWQEIDFGQELASIVKLHRYAANSSIQKIPRPFPPLCTTRVLTLEYLAGVRVSELMPLVPAGGERAIAALNARGIDLDRFAENLLTATLDQVFRNQFFHADPHPGNLMVMEGSRVGFVDFGLCQELDESVREGQMRYFSALYRRDMTQMFNALSDILVASDHTDFEAFRRDFQVETDAWIARRRTALLRSSERRQEGSESPLSQYMIGVMRAARRHELKVPTRVLSMYRALLMAETIANRLGTRADLASAGRAFFMDRRLEEAIDGLKPEQQMANVLQVAGLLRTAPGQVADLLAELSAGTFTLNVQVTDSPKLSRLRVRQTRLVVTAILAVAFSLLLSRPDLPVVFGVPLALPLALLTVAMYGWILIQWRKLA